MRCSIITLLIFFAFISACKKDDYSYGKTIAAIDFGDRVTKIESLGEYSKMNIVSLFQTITLLDKVETTSGFSLYRFSYNTTNFDNSAVVVTGLVAIPHSQNVKGVVCWLHGTNADRNSAPSAPSPIQGIDVAACFAGNEYILVAPDYIGLGKSKVFPTYMHKASTVKTSVDLIAIGKILLNEISPAAPNNLFIIGFSQGGGAASAVSEELKINNTTGLDLKATASVCGAFDLKNISLPYAIENNSTFYMGYVAAAYSKIYGQPVSSIINPAYSPLVEQLFNGDNTNEEITSKLPEKAEELYNASMISDIVNRHSNWFTDALEANQNFKWKPVSPFRIYYGENDKDVSPQDAISTYNYMQQLGGNVTLISVGQKDHFESIFSATPNIQQWFNSIK